MVLDSNLGECNCTVSEPEYAWVWLPEAMVISTGAG